MGNVSREQALPCLRQQVKRQNCDKMDGMDESSQIGRKKAKKTLGEPLIGEGAGPNCGLGWLVERLVKTRAQGRMDRFGVCWGESFPTG